MPAGTFAGYASTFNNVDSYGDTILPGAYTKALAAGMPKMFVQHESDELPVGKWIEAKQDNKGLYVVGEFTPGMADAADAYAALKHGTIDGLSIGYSLKSEDYEGSDTGRVISSISRLCEISLVTFPADNSARITMVKSEAEKLETVRDFERFLRDAGKFTKSEATVIIARAKLVFAPGEPALNVSPILEKISQMLR
jgi:HK97 family phage prohead protease